MCRCEANFFATRRSLPSKRVGVTTKQAKGGNPAFRPPLNSFRGLHKSVSACPVWAYFRYKLRQREPVHLWGSPHLETNNYEERPNSQESQSPGFEVDERVPFSNSPCPGRLRTTFSTTRCHGFPRQTSRSSWSFGSGNHHLVLCPGPKLEGPQLKSLPCGLIILRVRSLLLSCPFYTQSS